MKNWIFFLGSFCLGMMLGFSLGYDWSAEPEAVEASQYNDSLSLRYLQVAKSLDDRERNVVECETCGCLLKKKTAIWGEVEARLDSVLIDGDRGRWEKRFNPRGFSWVCIKDKVLKPIMHQPYYCKIHAPKKEDPIYMHVIPDVMDSIKAIPFDCDTIGVN